MSTRAQDRGDAQDTATVVPPVSAPIFVGPFHERPWNTNTLPNRSTETQNVRPEHETASRESSFTIAVGPFFSVVQDLPPKTATGCPAAMQNLVEGHETVVKADFGRRFGADQPPVAAASPALRTVASTTATLTTTNRPKRWRCATDDFGATRAL